ncbi:MAG: helix-turn-helix domain-containing protein [Planctomycetaceae bacterium]|jgi:excisionase family DNA binding protein|nr:hypothetical protein [bacterium]MDB4679615.1 hypothetical protein [Planctomycetaceae bacterium]MDG2390962.1 helix-turn-helix domain-containing protein [Planctomycetaceae bacterium]
MAKKYLSLEEAAEQLGISTDELKKLRESGEIRGFADRSSWKFRDEDVANHSRTMNPNSDAEISAIDDDDDIAFTAEDEPLMDDSASDVRLILDDDLTLEEDDDDIDEEIVASLGAGSDSDVKLVSSDSVADDDSANILVDDDDHSLPEDATMAAGSSIISGDYDSGITLEAADSGISLEAADSGISLESLDSSLNLSQDESATEFSLDDDSGISLDGAGDDVEKTVTMESLGDDDEFDMDDTAFEMETAGSSEDEISGLGDDDDDDTSVLLLDDDDESDAGSPTMIGGGEDDFEEDSFDLGDDDMGGFDDDDLMVEETVIGDDDELDDLDVFDAVDEDFDDDFGGGMGSAGEFAAPVGIRSAAVPEAEMGTGVFVGVVISSLLMALCGLMMIDLMRSMWSYEQPASYNSALLDMIKGFF